MPHLPMANDKDLAALAQTVAQTAVNLGRLSTRIEEDMAKIKQTQAAEAFQWRLVSALTRATTERLLKEGVSVPGLEGFFMICARLPLAIFRVALKDLDDRFLAATYTVSQHGHRHSAPLAVAMDFAAVQEPRLSGFHLQALCDHIASSEDVIA